MRLNQVTVGTVDVERAERFYTALGLHLIVKDDHYLRFECPDGESTFSVERVGRPPSGERVTVYFETDDVDGTCARLAGLGVEIARAPEDMSWLWREARLYDPDGHELCIYHAGSNRRFPPWRLPEGVA
jgi:catechol 2,3-dioxygenase-like lactoylglutathione lyase family enzyme